MHGETVKKKKHQTSLWFSKNYVLFQKHHRCSAWYKSHHIYLNPTEEATNYTSVIKDNCRSECKFIVYTFCVLHWQL